MRRSTRLPRRRPGGCVQRCPGQLAEPTGIAAHLQPPAGSEESRLPPRMPEPRSARPDLGPPTRVDSNAAARRTAIADASHPRVACRSVVCQTTPGRGCPPATPARHRISQPSNGSPKRAHLRPALARVTGDAVEGSDERRAHGRRLASSANSTAARRVDRNTGRPAMWSPAGRVCGKQSGDRD